MLLPLQAHHVHHHRLVNFSFDQNQPHFTSSHASSFLCTDTIAMLSPSQFSSFRVGPPPPPPRSRPASWLLLQTHGNIVLQRMSPREESRTAPFKHQTYELRHNRVENCRQRLPVTFPPCNLRFRVSSIIHEQRKKNKASPSPAPPSSGSRKLHLMEVNAPDAQTVSNAPLFMLIVLADPPPRVLISTFFAARHLQQNIESPTSLFKEHGSSVQPLFCSTTSVSSPLADGHPGSVCRWWNLRCSRVRRAHLKSAFCSCCVCKVAVAASRCESTCRNWSVASARECVPEALK